MSSLPASVYVIAQSTATDSGAQLPMDRRCSKLRRGATATWIGMIDSCIAEHDQYGDGGLNTMRAVQSVLWARPHSDRAGAAAQRLLALVLQLRQQAKRRIGSA